MTGSVAAVGMTTPVGLDAPSTAAAVRAGIARFAESTILDAHYEPFVVAAVPDAFLAPVMDDEDLSERTRRMLRLALPALAQVVETGERVGGLRLFLALPETPPGHPPAAGAEFLEQLARRAKDALALEASRTYSSGRAGALMALSDAIAFLDAGDAQEVLVGGVDSLVDADTLLAMERDGRILAENVGDGFIPGEGACFLRLTRSDAPASTQDAPLAWVGAAASGRDPGHRYGSEPYRGDGLSEIIGSALTAFHGGAPIRSVLAGLNGEFLGAKEWGVALVRNRPAFAEEFGTSHPADCFGDTGGAHSALLLGLAAIGLARGTTPGPCLVWASSDLADLGAAVLSEPMR